jgi:hypothetical protein
VSESEVSVAVKIGDPEVVELTMKVMIPELSVSPEAGEIVSVPPRLDARETVFPET